MKVELSELIKAHQLILSVNNGKLEDLEVYDQDQRLDICKENIAYWTYVGLNNSWYLTNVPKECWDTPIKDRKDV